MADTPDLRHNAAPTYDGVVILIVGALMVLGVAMAYSARISYEGVDLALDHWLRTPIKQTVFVMMGFLAMLLAAHFNYSLLRCERWRDCWRVGLIALVALALVAAMYIPGIGQRAMGAKRSIGVGSLSFQPPEVAKLVMVIWLAALLTSPVLDVRRIFRGFTLVILSLVPLLLLVTIEDFGTGVLMGTIMVGMLFAARARWWHLSLLVPLGFAAGVVMIRLKPHRWPRIRDFYFETPDPLDGGYQINQAMIAIGSGGWWGQGLGAGVQKSYLPQANNDFILAIICEELGIVGGMVVTALFIALLWRGWWIARRVPDLFGSMLALGLTLTIGLQAAFNIGVVTNSIPTKGISLPFVSTGGSGVIFLGLAAGLLAAIGGRACAASKVSQRSARAVGAR